MVNLASVVGERDLAKKMWKHSMTKYEKENQRLFKVYGKLNSQIAGLVADNMANKKVLNLLSTAISSFFLNWVILKFTKLNLGDESLSLHCLIVAECNKGHEQIARMCPSKMLATLTHIARPFHLAPSLPISQSLFGADFAFTSCDA